MKPDTLAVIRERLAQLRRSRNEAIGVALAAAQLEARRIGGTHVAGDVVFDVVSGQEGEVLGGTRENVLVSTANR
jgi:hypothetical protein